MTDHITAGILVEAHNLPMPDFDDLKNRIEEAAAAHKATMTVDGRRYPEPEAAAAPPEPADQDARRERYAAALRGADHGVELHDEGYYRFGAAAMTVADAESSRLRADLAEAEGDIDGWRAVLRRSDHRNDQLRAEVERLRAELETARKVEQTDTARLTHLEGENARLRAAQPVVLSEATAEAERFLVGEGYEGLADGLRDHLRRKADEAQQAKPRCTCADAGAASAPCPLGDEAKACTCGPDEACGDPCDAEAQQAGEGRHVGRGQAARSCRGCQDDINAQLSDLASKPIVICPGNEQAGEVR